MLIKHLIRIISTSHSYYQTLFFHREQIAAELDAEMLINCTVAFH